MPGDSELQGLDSLEAMQMKSRALFAIPIGLSLAGFAAAAGYSQQNLVSDGAVSAAHVDPDDLRRCNAGDHQQCEDSAQQGG